MIIIILMIMWISYIVHIFYVSFLETFVHKLYTLIRYISKLLTPLLNSRENASYVHVYIIIRERVMLPI